MSLPKRPRVRSRFVWMSIALHGLMVVLLVLVPRDWIVWLTLLVADHLVLVAASLWPRSTWVGPNIRRLSAERVGEAVALTFDDGPDPDVTPRVLEILEARGARATFFCVGARVEQFPELAAEIARRGHLVENHSHRHFNGFCFFPPRSLGREIDRAQTAIERCTGRNPCYFRAPAGLRNPWLDPLLAARDLELVSWSRRGFDTVTRDGDRVVRRLVRDLAAGDILLLHDGSSRTGADGRPVVLEALPAVLDELDRRGLRAIAIPPPGRG